MEPTHRLTVIASPRYAAHFARSPSAWVSLAGRVRGFLQGNRPFYLLVTGAFLALTIPRMAQSGMFLDGVTYAAISRNLASGNGDFWSPFYTSTLYPQYHEHLPLGFALQAAAFALFGDHLAVERVYSVVLGVLTAVLIVAIWRTSVRERDYDWLPLVFWLLPAGVTWSIVNNMLEDTQTAFTTLAVLGVVRGLESSRPFAWTVMSAVSVLAAVLTKGPTGLFPLAAPFVAAVVLHGRARKALCMGAVMILMTAAGSLAIFAPSVPRQALSTYWYERVVASTRAIQGGAGRWSSLARHLGGRVLLPMCAPLAIVAFCSWYRPKAVDLESSRPAGWSSFFLLLALAASIPVVVSARIAGHYLVPSIPIYALGFATFSLPLVRRTVGRWRDQTMVRRAVGLVGVALIVGSVAAPVLGGAFDRRDVELMNDFSRLSSLVPRGATVGTCQVARADWGIHAYMMRFFEVSLDTEPGDAHRYYLQLVDRRCDAPAACHSIASTGHLALLDCR